MLLSFSYLHFPINWAKKSILSFYMPSNLSYYWNFGSMLGMVLVVQILTGLFLSFNYSSSVPQVFFLVNLITKETFWGNIFRILHLNFASFFFLFLYLHLLRGIYYQSYSKTMIWMSGVTILLVLMATAFLGYVLPWGQMSFWGATVITNLFSALPFIGPKLVTWLWGGFMVSQSTLSFFYSLHFLLPFVLAAVALIHLIFLHEKGSKNNIFLNGKNKTLLLEFNNFLMMKDMVNLIVLLILFMFALSFPYLLGDTENFILANSLTSPLHIKPEWYFLFAYAILRAVPNKLGGVLALFLSVVLFYFFPKKKVMPNSLMKKISVWYFVFIFILLTWLGGNSVEYPYTEMSQVTSILYFLFLLLI